MYGPTQWFAAPRWRRRNSQKTIGMEARVSGSRKPIIKVQDAHYARLAAPDLDKMEHFLRSIGLIRAHRTETHLYMRGTGPEPFLNVTELGEPRFLGLGFKAAAGEDLAALAEATGVPVRASEDFGGGSCVALKDPNGFRVDVCHGFDDLETIPVPPLRTNSADAPSNRTGRGPWGPETPPHALRFGHAVMRTPRFKESVDWYRHHLGLICSDQIVDAEGNVTGAFNRIDRGDAFVDHHALLISKSEACGWHHASYEVHNWSEVFEAAALIRREGLYKVWRPPIRHFLGGQVGAYVADAWGRVFEFWADGDRLNGEHQPRNWTAHDIETLGPNWENQPDPAFRTQLSN